MKKTLGPVFFCSPGTIHKHTHTYTHTHIHTHTRAHTETFSYSNNLNSFSQEMTTFNTFYFIR